MKRLIPPLTPLGKLLVIATPVLAVAVMFTNAVPVMIAFAAVLMAWVWIIVNTDPLSRRRREAAPKSTGDARLQAWTQQLQTLMPLRRLPDVNGPHDDSSRPQS